MIAVSEDKEDKTGSEPRPQSASAPQASAVSGVSQRKRILFFRPPSWVWGGRFYPSVLKPKEDVLAHFFDVSVASSASSLRRELRTGRIDAVVFYVSYEVDRFLYCSTVLRCLRGLTIPKFMLHNTDPFFPSREYPLHVARAVEPNAVFLCDPVMEAYQIFERPVFHWVWSVNPDDYPLVPKSHELFISSRNSPRAGFYMWRAANSDGIKSLFQSHRESIHDPWKEYQLKIGSCRFAYTCGSCTNTIVNKHLEIPASGTCLITESTSLVRSLGFQDMENCIWGTGDELLEKINKVRSDPELCHAISMAGRNLVFHHHCHSKRIQIRDVIENTLAGVPCESLVQPDPVGRVRIASGQERSPPARYWLAESPPRDLALIRAWDKVTDREEKEHELARLQEFLIARHPDLLLASQSWYRRTRDRNRLATVVREGLLGSIIALFLLTPESGSVRNAIRLMILDRRSLRARKLVLGMLRLAAPNGKAGLVRNLASAMSICLAGIIGGAFHWYDPLRAVHRYMRLYFGRMRYLVNLWFRGK